MNSGAPQRAQLYIVEGTGSSDGITALEIDAMVTRHGRAGFEIHPTLSFTAKSRETFWLIVSLSHAGKAIMTAPGWESWSGALGDLESIDPESRRPLAVFLPLEVSAGLFEGTPSVWIPYAALDHVAGPIEIEVHAKLAGSDRNELSRDTAFLHTEIPSDGEPPIVSPHSAGIWPVDFGSGSAVSGVTSRWIARGEGRIGEHVLVVDAAVSVRRHGGERLSIECRGLSSGTCFGSWTLLPLNDLLEVPEIRFELSAETIVGEAHGGRVALEVVLVDQTGRTICGEVVDAPLETHPREETARRREPVFSPAWCISDARSPITLIGSEIQDEPNDLTRLVIYLREEGGDDFYRIAVRSHEAALRDLVVIPRGTRALRKILAVVPAAETTLPWQIDVFDRSDRLLAAASAPPVQAVRPRAEIAENLSGIRMVAMQEGVSAGSHGVSLILDVDVNDFDLHELLVQIELCEQNAFNPKDRTEGPMSMLQHYTLGRLNGDAGLLARCGSGAGPLWVQTTLDISLASIFAEAPQALASANFARVAICSRSGRVVETIYLSLESLFGRALLQQRRSLPVAAGWRRLLSVGAAPHRAHSKSGLFSLFLGS